MSAAADPFASIAQPVQADPFASIAKSAPPIEPGFLDRDIPLSGPWYNPTLSGVQSIGRGVRDAVSGAYNAVRHPIDTAVATAKGIAALPSEVAQVPSAIHDINQSPDPLGTYAKVAQDTAGEGAGQALVAAGTLGLAKAAPVVAKTVSGIIPSAADAGAALEDVKSAAGSIPIDTSKVGNTALDIYTQSQRGANLPSSVGKLVRRLASPDSPPMTYEEAKDFQSNISRLSADENMKMNPNTRRLVGQLNQDLKGSLQDAADTVGKGQKFADAMKEYHNAMRLKGFSDAAIDAAWKSALTATGLYGVKKVIEAAQ
jgi:hypothetical protein